MNKVILNGKEHERNVNEVISLAKGLLSGEVDYLMTVGKLSSLRHEIDENDEDFNIFVAVSSETDHMPIGELRNNCSESWLKNVTTT
jgi:hypothetical protein